MGTNIHSDYIKKQPKMDEFLFVNWIAEIKTHKNCLIQF